MPEDLSPTTAWLSLLLGAYLVAGGIGAWLRGDKWRELTQEFERSPALVAITGALAFAIGAAIVTAHNVWTGPAAIIVTLAGWIAVVEGLSLIAVPRLWLGLTRPLIGAARWWGAAMILIGAFLIANTLLIR